MGSWSLETPRQWRGNLRKIPSLSDRTVGRREERKEGFGLVPSLTIAEGPLSVLGPGSPRGPSTGAAAFPRERRTRKPRAGVHLGWGTGRKAGGEEKEDIPPSCTLSRGPEQREKLSLLGQKC